MEHYVGLDVSLKLTAICIVDRTGKIEREGVVSFDREAIAGFVKSHAPHVARIGLETGATATWLWSELRKLGLPVICIDARHAKAALKMQINKSDRLVKIKRDLENQIRGLLKNLGLVIGRAKMTVFAVRAAELTEERPDLATAVVPLLRAREAVEEQIADLDRKVLRLARTSAQVRRFMTVPGVGPITALCFLATIDDPARFKRSRSVGAYVGLTTRRYASGEVDWTGRISKCGQDAAQLRLRSRQSAAHPCGKVVATQSLGHQTGEAQRAAQSQGCSRSKAGRHSAPDVDRRHRIHLVINGGDPSSCIKARPNSRRPAGTNVPAGTLALVRSPLALRCSREQTRFTH